MSDYWSTIWRNHMLVQTAQLLAQRAHNVERVILSLCFKIYYHLSWLTRCPGGSLFGKRFWDPRRNLDEFHVHHITIYSNQTCLNRLYDNYSSEYFSRSVCHINICSTKTGLNKLYARSFIISILFQHLHFHSWRRKLSWLNRNNPVILKRYMCWKNTFVCCILLTYIFLNLELCEVALRKIAFSFHQKREMGIGRYLFSFKWKIKTISMYVFEIHRKRKINK